MHHTETTHTDYTKATLSFPRAHQRTSISRIISQFDMFSVLAVAHPRWQSCNLAPNIRLTVLDGKVRYSSCPLV
jgi:hypothetical protein